MNNFIKACVSILPKKLQDFYYKYEEKFNYLIFGGLTTVIAIVTKLIIFAVISGESDFEDNIAIIVSWICAVTFAYITNSKYVFKSEATTKKEHAKEVLSFFTARASTLVMEKIIFKVFCSILGINKTFITFASQVLIFIANYVLSKLLVFKKKK